MSITSHRRRPPWARIPFVASLSGYSRHAFAADVVAGVLITATAIPLGVGFASAAGLPPVTGLYTSIAPLVVFGLAASTRQVKLGLDAAAAAMIGAAIVPLATVNGVADQGRLVALVALVTALTGVILLVAGLARAGFLADLLSFPLLIGYQAGIGISVIIGQLPKMMGVAAGGDSDLEKLADVVQAAAGADLPTLALGAGALVTLWIVRAKWPAVPGALIVLIIATAASAAFDFAGRGIATIGELPRGLPGITVPDFGALASDFPRIAGVAASLALVLGSDVLITSRTFAARGHYRVSANQDMVGLGLAQIAGAFTGAAAASASYARTAITERSGSKTQVSAVIGGLAMTLVVATLTDGLEPVPLAVLGAICVDACLRLVDVDAFRRLWRVRRSSFAIAIATGALVLATDPLLAIGVAVGLSLLTFLKRAVWPRASRLGKRRGIRGWWSRSDFDDAVVTDENVVVYRWNAPLIFVNANGFRDKVEAECAARPEWLVIDCGAMFDIDPSALVVLEELATDLRDQGTELAFAAPSPEAASAIRASDLLASLGDGPRMFSDIDTALTAIGRGPAPDGDLKDPDGDGVFEYVRTAG